ncbi:MAG: gamma-butyrobetaine hydroxylase-like domain-containing protein [Salinivenus sp.]
MRPPSRLEVDTKTQTLTVRWQSNLTSVFPLDALRQACPCANCGGESVEAIAPPQDEYDPDRTWTDLTIEPAGSVGIRITWDDGHSAGIFRWDRLRRLQPPAPSNDAPS